MRILITGGAGFIGCHAAARFMREHDVTVLDDLSGRGAKANLEWLGEQGKFTLAEGDIRDTYAMQTVIGSLKPDVVLHLAAQVAVTTSVLNPLRDFKTNALGTLNVLEAVRRVAPEALVLYASTNKVYGEMDHVTAALIGQRWQYASLPYGVNEDMPLDFHSPYGCSKGAADQYVRDYARVYGLRTIVFRQSCAYGTRQFGVEDQGWLAWFAICAVLGKPVTIYGDGFQVRDVLWVDDLIDLYQAAIDKPDRGVFNIGGGPANQISLIESIELIERLVGNPLLPQIRYADPRPGDQCVYVSDTRRAAEAFDWQPRVTPAEGIERLVKWITDNKELLA